MLHTVKKNMYEPKGKSLVIRLKLALLRSVRLEDQGHCLLQTPGYEYSIGLDGRRDVLEGWIISFGESSIISDRRLTRVFILEDPRVCY